VVGNISISKTYDDHESMTITPRWDILIAHTEELFDEQPGIISGEGIKLKELL